MRTLGKKTHDPIIYYAKLCRGFTDNSFNQAQAIERQFLLESKKDIIDSDVLDKYFTRLLILCEEIIDETRILTNMILERE